MAEIEKCVRTTLYHKYEDAAPSTQQVRYRLRRRTSAAGYGPRPRGQGQGQGRLSRSSRQLNRSVDVAEISTDPDMGLDDGLLYRCKSDGFICERDSIQNHHSTGKVRACPFSSM